MTETILRPTELARRLGIARSTLYEWAHRDPTFPPKLKLGRRAAGWRASDIEAWLDAKANERGDD